MLAELIVTSIRELLFELRQSANEPETGTVVRLRLPIKRPRLSVVSLVKEHRHRPGKYQGHLRFAARAAEKRDYGDEKESCQIQKTPSLRAIATD